MGRRRKIMAEEAKITQEETTPEVKEVAQRPSSVNRSGRKKRVPINGYRDVLKVEGQEPGYHYCWVRNDLVEKYQQSDYEFVTHEVKVGHKKINAASQIGSSVTIPGGNGVTLHLMRIPNEYYDEDMEALHQEIDEKEAVMFQQLNSKEGGRYGEVEIKHGVNRR